MRTPTEIAGRYRVERRLGAGGMSTVFLATDGVLERLVAIKLLADHLAEDDDFVARFRREALAAARLQHPNIVQVFDSGEDTESRRHFIVMEFVDGPSCADMLRDQKQLEIEEAVQIVRDACHGLDYAHRAGVVHRDVKPGNLLLGDESRSTKLADFGIAKAAEQTRITQVGSVLGTAAYLSPEQARGDEAGPPSDIYSLGVCAYQFLTGRLPHEYTSLTELALKQQQEDVDPIVDLRPEVPPELDRAIRVALERDAERRYSSTLEMARSIEAGLDGLETEATRRLAVGMPSAPPLGDEATRALGPVTDATRAMRDRRTGAHAPAPVPAPVPRRQQPARRSREAGAAKPKGRRRRLGMLLALLAAAIAAAAVAFALFASDGGNGDGGGGGANFEAIQREDVEQQIDDLRQFLDDNVR